MDWDCKIGVRETLPVASSLLEGNGDLGETKTGLCHNIFFSTAPRHGEWKIPVHMPAHMKPCFKNVPHRWEVCKGISAKTDF